MPKRKRHWFIESMDSFTGKVCAQLLDQPEAELRRVRGPRPKHLWPCQFEDIQRLHREKSKGEPVSFRIWSALEGDMPRRWYPPKEAFRRNLRLVTSAA